MENHDFSRLIPNFTPVKRVFSRMRVDLSSKTAIKYWWYLLHPAHYFCRLGKTCKYWDKALLRMLHEPKSLRRVSSYTIELNGVKIWVSNYPYSYGYEHADGHGRLPSRKTVVLLKLLVEALDDKIYQERYK